MATSSSRNAGTVVEGSSDLPASSPITQKASSSRFLLTHDGDSRSIDSPAPRSQQPLFANPFMASFLPQTVQLHPLLKDSFEGGELMQTSQAGLPNLSQGPVQQAPDRASAGAADFRVNPLTGGYFLSPNQYQDMMQQYVQGLMLAAHGQNQKALSEKDKKTNATLLNSELKDAFASTSATVSQPEPSSLLSSFVDAQNVASNLALLDVQACSSEQKDVAKGAISPTVSTAPQSADEDPWSSEHRSSSPLQNTTQQVCLPSPVSMTEVVEAIREEVPSTSSSQETFKAGEAENQVIVDQTKNGLPQQEPEEEEEKILEYPKEEEQKAVPGKKGTAAQNPMQHDQRTSELIKKQINEIEREISRRIQNKNVKKMDEAELAQLLSDHGFGNFVGFANAPLEDESGIPYRPAPINEDISESTKASLNQLRSSFSPPPHEAGQSAPHTQQPTCSAGGPELHGRSAFMTGPVMPQQATLPPLQHHYIAGGIGEGVAPSFGGSQLFDPPNQKQQMASPTSASPFYAAALQQHLPQQQFYAHPSFGMTNYNGDVASSTPPVLSNISAEMAAALLQQLQQQNPALIQNLVEQQKQYSRARAQTSRSPVAVIPAPPLPNYNVSRRPNGTGTQNSMSRKLSVGSTNVSSTSKSTTKSVGNQIASPVLDENGWFDIGKRHGSISYTSSQGSSIPAAALAQATTNGGENKENGSDPIWVMRDSYLKRLQREEQRHKDFISTEKKGNEDHNNAQHATSNGVGLLDNNDELQETDKLLMKEGGMEEEVAKASVIGVLPTTKKSSTNKKEVMVHEPAVLIEGVLFRARYLGSTQLVCDGRPTKTSRMAQAQEAVARVKAPDGEIQPSTEIDLFISTEKIMVLNTDLQRISETDVRQDILMDHSLRSISYIADIGDLVVLMARRVPQPTDAVPSMAGSEDDEESETIRRAPRVVCHVFESEEASFIAQSIGQAFQVAYVEFLRANGIDDPAYLREIDYQEVLNSQELMGEELEMFARKETQKDVVVPKKVGEALGVVVVESGWGSMLPTVVVANMAPGGPASRSNQLNIGDQIIAINGISLVGLPLASAQQNIKNSKTSTAVRLTIVSTPPVVEVRIKRPDTKYQLGFSVQNGVICSLLRGGIAERGGIRVGHRIIEINHLSVVAVPHERIVNMLATATGEIHMKTMPTSMFRLLTGQEVPNYI